MAAPSRPNSRGSFPPPPASGAPCWVWTGCCCPPCSFGPLASSSPAQPLLSPVVMVTASLPRPCWWGVSLQRPLKTERRPQMQSALFRSAAVRVLLAPLLKVHQNTLSTRSASSITLPHLFTSDLKLPHMFMGKRMQQTQGGGGGGGGGGCSRPHKKKRLPFLSSSVDRPRVYSTVGFLGPLGSMLSRLPLDVPAALMASALACPNRQEKRVTLLLHTAQRFFSIQI